MSQLIPQHVIDQVRQETNIVDVISEYVQLKKSGKNYLGLCPFHNEKTPSFTVAEEKQIFHCFGCGKGGNVFTFIQEIDGLSFPEAVDKLARPLNLNLELNSQQMFGQRKTENSEDQQLINIHEKTKEFYQHLLLNTQIGEKALAYLESRGLSIDIIEEFELGFAPQNREILRQVMTKENIDSNLLKETGLFVETDSGSMLDRFYQRIMFPIKNRKGQTIGFSGRWLDLEGFDNDKQPKYLNSPETALFNKRDVIYNYHRARPFVRKTKEVYLFEGFMDVIASAISGISNGVATMGTSLTTDQVSRLERISDTIIVAYDGDNAGVEATDRAVTLLAEHSSLEVQVISFPQQLDPDDYRMMYGPEKLKLLLENTKQTVFQFKKEHLKRSYNLANESDKVTYLEVLLKELANIPSIIEKDMALTHLSEEFDISKDSLQQQLTGMRKARRQENFSNHSLEHMEPVVPQYQEIKKISQAEQAEKLLIYRLLNERSTYLFLSKLEDFSFIHDEYQEMYQHMSDYYENYGNIVLADFINYLKEDYLKSLLISLTVQSFSQESSEQELNDCLIIINKERVLQQINTLKRQQKEAQTRGDSSTELTITMNIIKLQQQLNNV